MGGLITGEVLAILTKNTSANRRFVEHEDHVDVEEIVHGIWAVTHCGVPKPRTVYYPVVVVDKPVIKYVHRAEKPKYQEVKKRGYGFRQEDVRLATKLKTYGLSKDEYDKMVLKQNGKCYICKKKQPLHINNGELNIDHDHKTGKVRGLLCNSCNTGLGQFRDDRAALKRALRYLEKD